MAHIQDAEPSHITLRRLRRLFSPQRNEKKMRRKAKKHAKRFGRIKINAYLCNRKQAMVPWMSGLVNGLQNRLQQFESARHLQRKRLIEHSISLFCFVRAQPRRPITAPFRAQEGTFRTPEDVKPFPQSAERGLWKRPAHRPPAAVTHPRTKKDFLFPLSRPRRTTWPASPWPCPLSPVPRRSKSFSAHTAARPYRPSAPQWALRRAQHQAD